MDDFIFKGRDIAEFGAVAAFGESMRIGGKIMPRAYTLPGGGSVEIGEAVHQATQRTVTLTPSDGVDGSVAWARRLLGWLQSGRGEMIVKHDPEIMRIAEFGAEGTYGTRNWPLGGVQTTMTLQPLAYSVREASFRADTSGGELTAALNAESAYPMPLRIGLTVTGGTVERVRMTAGGQTLELEGMALGAGQTLLYDAGQLLGDAPKVEIDGALTFAPLCSGRWARLAIAPDEAVSISATGGEARVTVSGRGRWPS